MRAANLKTIFFILPVFICQYLTAQNFSYPAAKASGKTIKDFIPADWLLKDSSFGDLNGDKTDDLALVIQYKDTLEEMRPDKYTNTGSPRILLVFFKNTVTGNYDLVQQNNTFILRYGEGGMDPDPYGEVRIRNNTLHVEFWFLRSSSHYIFRYQQNDFYLIGASNSGTDAGKYEEWDINFSTKKAKHSWGKADSDKTQEKWVAVPVTEKKKLKDMRMPFLWEVMPHVFI